MMIRLGYIAVTGFIREKNIILWQMALWNTKYIREMMITMWQILIWYCLSTSVDIRQLAI